MGMLDDLLSFGKSGPIATPDPTGSNMAGYRNFDLSNFTPGGSAPALQNVSPLNMGGTDVPGGSGGSILDSVLGNAKTGRMGWGGLALGAASALGNAWMGMKQYGLAKDSLKENRRQFDLNFNAQKQMVNSQLEDRQRARNASNPTAYESTGSYMNKYGVK